MVVSITVFKLLRGYNLLSTICIITFYINNLLYYNMSNKSSLFYYEVQLLFIDCVTVRLVNPLLKLFK